MRIRSENTMITHWHGRRVTVMGLGRFGGGVGVTRWLAAQGARITVTDSDPAEKLSASLDQLRGLDLQLRLGGHDERDFRDADLIVVNPAVKPDSPFLQLAATAGVPVATELNLFVERCRGVGVGVTGTVGKSTTTAMLGHVLQRCSPARRVWVGGNIGICLLDRVHEIAAEDLVVLELSSFQLERLPAVDWSPLVAVITNIAANHLDWHGSFDAYVSAKLNIARRARGPEDALILDGSRELADAVDRAALPARQRWHVGQCDGVPCAWQASVANPDAPTLTWADCRLALPGRHNCLNAAAALSAAHALGVSPGPASAALSTFEALPHRLQLVAERDGVRYYDDSKSTTPEALDTALAAFDEPLLLIVGGYDKGADLRPTMRRVAARARLAACIGVTAPVISETIRAAGGRAELCDDLAAAVRCCKSAARAGDVVLLSPGCASWGMFSDYRERGLAFAALVRA